MPSKNSFVRLMSFSVVLIILILSMFQDMQSPRNRVSAQAEATSVPASSQTIPSSVEVATNHTAISDELAQQILDAALVYTGITDPNRISINYESVSSIENTIRGFIIVQQLNPEADLGTREFIVRSIYDEQTIAFEGSNEYEQIAQTLSSDSHRTFASRS